MPEPQPAASQTSEKADKGDGAESPDKTAVPEGGVPEEGGGAVEKKPSEVSDERETWGSKIGYLLTLVGYAVGFGNIWRFPPLMAENGGVAFLIPYTFMLAFCGIPLFFLELAIGQRLKKSALGCWNEISPTFGGVGILSGFTSFFVEFYYNTLVAWVILYIMDSFWYPLKWSNCQDLKDQFARRAEIRTSISRANETAPEECMTTEQSSKYYEFRRMLDVSDSITDPGNFNGYMLFAIIIGWALAFGILARGIKTSEKVVYFTALFPYVILLIFFFSNFANDGWLEGYQTMFKPNWKKLIEPKVWKNAGAQIFFSLGLSFGCLITFASHLPSKNNCFKDAVAVSFINCGTSLFAAITLFPIFGSLGKARWIRCRMNRRVWGLISVIDFLKSGNETLTKFIKPSASSIIDQLGLMQVARVDRFNEETRAFLASMVRILPEEDGSRITSITLMGEELLESPFDLTLGKTDRENITILQNCTLDSTIRSGGFGTTFVFIGFAEAVLSLPFPPLWSVLFFLMLFTLGIDSSFGTLEGAIAPVVDLKIFPRRTPRWVITGSVTGILAVFSIVFCWGWGVYIQDFMDKFVANWSLLVVGVFETIVVSWVYGLARFAYDIKLMTGQRPNMFIMICWKFVTPGIILALLIYDIVDTCLSYAKKGGVPYDKYNKDHGDLEDGKLDIGLVVFGYLLLAFMMMWVPLQAILVKFFHKSLLKAEISAPWEEDELRRERNLKEDDEEEFDSLDRAVMGKSIEDFQTLRRQSKSDPSIPAGETPTPEKSKTDTKA